MVNVVHSVSNRMKRGLDRFALLSFRVSLASFDLANKLSAPSVLLKPGSCDRKPSSTVIPSGSLKPNRTESIASDSVPSDPKEMDRHSFLPIIFLHKSNSDYLKYSLGQAKSSNPNSTVYLLGDGTNALYDFVEHCYFSEYFEGAAEFAKVYRHYSTLGIDTELLWFQRWFILRDFLRAKHLDACLYLDSDIMLYTDVTEDRKKFANFDFTLCWNTIGCVFFLNRLEGLDAFCQFVLDVYSKKDRYHYDKMVCHYATRRKSRLPGGACDMTALQLYSELNFGRIGEAAHVINGSFYDPNMNAPHPGFEMDGGIKKVIWKDRQPYGRYITTGEEIRFNSMHFQGSGAKRLMRQYYTGDPSLTAAVTEMD